MGSSFRRGLRRLVVFCALAALAGPAGAQGGVTPSTRWVNFYGMESLYDDKPLPAGSVVGAFDTTGTQCGEYALIEAGWYGLMACYGDDSFTPQDEGADYGEPVQFTIGAMPAIAVPMTLNNATVAADTIITWSGNQDLWRVELRAPATVGPQTDIEVDGADVLLTWPPEPISATTFEVWRSGDPYFVVGAWGSQEVANVPAQAGKVAWRDAGQAANATAARFYRVRALDTAGAPVSLPAPIRGSVNFALTGEQQLGGSLVGPTTEPQAGASATR